MESEKTYIKDSIISTADKERQLILDDNISRYNRAVQQSVSQFSNLELARRRAGYIRYKAINGLEKYLIEFEANFERNGGKVIWAQDSAEAVKEILNILRKNKVNLISKTRSLICDEINLVEKLKEEDIECMDINPGDFILKQFDEKPRHLSSVLIHKSYHEITSILEKKFKVSFKHNPIEILEFVRKNLRVKIETSTASITGANYLIADTGSICISENSGEAVINNSFPKLQIVIAGIDKIIPSLMNLDAFVPLYATYSSGERINTFNTIISGPRQDSEKDGPFEMFVVLIDNGRSEVLAQKFQRRALGCIDCGACQNVCPVNRKTFGISEGNSYSGPIGSIITPWMKGLEENIHLSYSSTLCGSCTAVCPVDINLHELLINNRSDSIKKKNYSFTEGLTMSTWHQVLKNRKWMDWGKPKWKNMILKKLYSNRWGSERKMPTIADKSFKQLWEERREGIN